MSSAPEEFSNIQINDEMENRPVIKMDYSKNDSISISVNSQITNDNSQNSSVRASRRNKISQIQRSLTSTLLLSNRKTLYIENEFFPEKEDSAFDLLFFCKKNEDEENKENKENKEIKEEKTENKDEKIENKENNTENKEIKEIKENNIEIKEIKENKIEIKEAEIKNNVNNVKISVVNNNICLKANENCNINKNIQKNIKKNIVKNDNYTQTYSRNDFGEKPPKVSTLFIHDYDYENKNIFSHSNETAGDILESKKIPNIFYNHLLINKDKNERYITTSLNKNNHGKLLTFLYYAP